MDRPLLLAALTLAGSAAACSQLTGALSTVQSTAAPAGVYVALAPAAAADGTTLLYGAAAVPLTSLTFCVGANGDCNAGAQRLETAVVSRADGSQVYAAKARVTLADGLVIGAIGVPAATGAAVLTSKIKIADATGTAPATADDGLYHEDPFAPTALTYAKLKAMIQAQGIRSLDGLLAALKATPDNAGFFAKFALVYDSQSQQAAAVSPQFPRIIMHQDGLIAAMTGNPDLPDTYDTVELIELDPATRDFAFHRVLFHAATGADATFEDAPTTCAQCHGPRLRPIWGEYPLWSGAYGASEDGRNFGPGGTSSTPPLEASRLAAFLASVPQPKQARYQLFRTAEFLAPAEGVVEPNFTLGRHLAHLNYQSLITELRATSTWDQLKYATLAATINCQGIGSLSGYLPQAAIDQRVQAAAPGGSGINAAIEAQYSVVPPACAAESQRRVDRFNRDNGTALPVTSFRLGPYGDDSSAMMALRTLYAGLPLDLSQWAIFRGPGGVSYNFQNGEGDIGEFGYDALLPEVCRDDPAVCGLRDGALCQVLADKSLKATTP